jgi:hypothetical protein
MSRGGSRVPSATNLSRLGLSGRMSQSVRVGNLGIGHPCSKGGFP